MESVGRACACCVVGLTGLVNALSAQEVADTALVPPLVITATRLPMDPHRITARVTVITGAQLRASGVTYLADALRDAPGVSVARSGSFGSVTSAFVRGGQSDYVQVLIDGVPVNDPGGAYNWADLSVANIERVEVMRGPAGVLYGTDAVTGVVHIITKEGAGPTRASAEVRTGTYGTLDVTAGASGGSGDASFSAQVRRTDTDGTLAFNNQYDNTTLSGRLTLAPDERTRAAISLRYTESEYHFPTDGSGALVDSNRYTLHEATTVGLEVSRYFSETVHAEMLAGLSLGDGGGIDEPDFVGDTVGSYASRSQRSLARITLEGRAHVYLPLDGVATIGAVVERQSERSVADFQSSFGPFSSTVDVERTNAGGYVQLLGQVADPVSLQLGGRVDRNEAFGTFVTGRAGATVDVTASTRLSASVGTAFKEPTFIENFGGGFVVGNEELVPERVVSWEMSAEQSLFSSRLVVAATYFDQRFRDLIQFTAMPAVPDDGNFYNVAAANANGVELEGQLRATPTLRIWGTYTYLHSRVTDPGFQIDPGGEFEAQASLLRRPSYALALGGRYELGRVGVGGQYRYVGSRADLDFATFPSTRVTLPGYHVVDVYGDVTLVGRPDSRSIDLTARIENLLDEEYQEIVGFAAAGRLVMVGVRVGSE